jgi:L-ascorbate metabolism protein UlaG (beta-lactamase superfamily)
MIKPVLQDDAFIEDVRQHRHHVHLWWLGQSGFLVKHGGHFLLIDPYLSDSLTKKYEATDKPHVRLTERVVDPARLDFINVVTSSHNHTDHLDAETLLPLIAANPNLKLVIPEVNRAFVAERLHCDPAWPIGLDIGRSTYVSGYRIEAVPAAHEQLSAEYVGYVIEAGRVRIYHAGDTVLYEGMADRLRPLKVDIALLPINGSSPERRVAGNLNGREAAQLAYDIGAKTAIPMHYDMFTFNTASPDEFVAECARLGQNCRILNAGERVDWKQP